MPNVLKHTFKNYSDYHSEFRLLEVTRYTQLTDKQIMHFYELRKLPKNIGNDDLLLLWLALFKANTEVEIQMIEEQGVSEINEAITAYRHLSRSKEFLELERQRDKARLREATLLANAEKKGVAKGVAKGEAKSKAEIARKLKQSGLLPIAEIAKITELTVEEVEKL